MRGRGDGERGRGGRGVEKWGGEAREEERITGGRG
jgi:hypothetical protein